MSTRYVPPPTTSSPAVPRSVGTASALWFVAVGAGVFEAALAVAGMLADGSASFAGIAVGLGLRLAVFATAVFATVRMRRGRDWARFALALGLGVLGTLSLVVDPVLWLLAGNSLGGAVADAGAAEFAFAASRIVHLAAVLAATALMFVPSANTYFRNR